MDRRRGPDENARRYGGGRKKIDENYLTYDNTDFDQGFTRGRTDSDLDKGRNGGKPEVGDTDEESDDDDDSEDDLSSCSDGDNYKTNTKALLDRIKEQWQR
jgi:hypothetical protein